MFYPKIRAKHAKIKAKLTIKVLTKGFFHYKIMTNSYIGGLLNEQDRTH